jgi:rod shape-determining protein MreD
MNPLKLRRGVASFLMVVTAAALQTTLFVRFRVLDTAPALVLLVVIALARHLAPEIALLMGFAAGLLQDLLSDSPLGLWALTFTTVGYAVVRLRERMEEDFSLFGPFVFAVSAAAIALFAVLGTIFGEKTLADAGLWRKIVLPSLYNALLAGLMLPFATWALGATPKRAQTVAKYQS